MADPLASLAFEPPDLGALVPRGHLRSWIGPRTAVWILVGGPGAGKTATALQIAEHLAKPVLWFRTLPAVATGEAGVRSLEEDLRSQCPQGLTVVFDGAEAWQAEPGGAEFLESWLRTCGTPLFTVVTTRQPLPFALTRRRALDEVRQLEPAELWFSPEEVAAALGVREAPRSLRGTGKTALRGTGERAAQGPSTVLLEAAELAGGWPLAVACLSAGAGADAPADLVRELVRDELIGSMPSQERRAAALLSSLTGVAPNAVKALGLPDALSSWGLWHGKAGAWLPTAREFLRGDWEKELAEAARLKRSGDFDGLAAWLAGLPQAALGMPAVGLLQGAVHQARGAFPDAAHRFENALEGYRALGDRPGMFEALGDLLHLRWTMQDFEGFKIVAAQAEAYEADATLGERVEYFNNLACFHFGNGDEARAGRLFQKALDYPHLGDAQIASVQQFASINLGIIEMERGEFDKATAHYERVLALAERFPLKRSVSRGARLYLAATALRLGDRDAAEARITALEADPFPAEDSFRRGEFMVLEGDYHLLTGDRDRAEERYRAALAAFAAIRMDESAEAGAATNRLAVIHRRRGEPEAALKLHARAMGMVRDWPRYAAAVALDWAITLLVADRLPEASTRLAEALEALTKAPAPHLEAGVMLAKAVLADRDSGSGSGSGSGAGTGSGSGTGSGGAKVALERAVALLRQGPYYYVAIAQRELAPDVWALLAVTGHEAMLGNIESRFPIATRAIRGELEQRPRESVALPPAAPPAIEIRCFGTLEVRVAGQPVTAWPRKKAKALLGHLVVAPSGLSREELSDRLFPDLGLDEAEHQLDNMTSTLRKLLEPELARRQKSRFLAVKDRLYRFETADAWVDLREFDAAYSAGTRAWQAGSRAEAASALQRCADLYRGDLLGEPLLLEWFELERQRCRARAVDALGHLAEHRLDCDQPEPAREFLARIVTLDPANEDAHRRLMRLFDVFGRKDLVRRQFELCAAAVQQELETAPAPETVALFKNLIA